MIYIRTDMNATIATGHVMRCLSIADAAKQLGEDVTLLLADNQAEELIRKRGFHTIILNTKWDDMESELPIIEKAIYENKIEGLLIDSYQVTPGYLSHISKLTKTIYIDDLNSFHYPVDAIICYANYWKKFKYEESYSDTKLYLGLDYVPLRAEFHECPPKKIRERVKNLLLLSGGTDNYDILDSILDNIPLAEFNTINVICGKFYQNYHRLCEKYRNYKNVVIKEAVNNIEEYMLKADVAISAGGTTLYELCAMGTPAISYSFADNQINNVKQFAKDGIIDYAGDVRYDDMYNTISHLILKYEDKEFRQLRTKKMQHMVDGKGAMRVAEILVKNNYCNLRV